MSSNSDECDAMMCRMWHRHPGQLRSMIRMHLSFVLDLSTDDLSAPLPQPAPTAPAKSETGWRLLSFSTRSKCKSSDSVVTGGCVVPPTAPGASITLSQEGVCQLYQLIEYLGRRQNVDTEGLFRKTGNIARQQELHRLLVSGVSLDLDSQQRFSAHDCACVLKCYLASLSDPLLTSALFSAHVQTARLCTSDTPEALRPIAAAKQLRALRLLLLLLPADNRQLLRDLLQLLAVVAAHSQSNLMTPLNLGTVFAPHLLCPRQMSAVQMAQWSPLLSQAVAVMIQHAERLHVPPVELMVDVRAFLQSGGAASASSAALSLRAEAQVNTVFTFVDRQRSAVAGRSSDTDTALADLYAQVRAMPDSARKRRLVKQFNRQNGKGTPSLPGKRVTTHPQPQKHSPPPPVTPRASLRQPVFGRRSLLTPVTRSTAVKHTAAAAKLSTAAVKSTASPLPGIARRDKLTARIHAFRTGRHSSMRCGQTPLRTIQVTSTPRRSVDSHRCSPISCRLGEAPTGTVHLMLTPRNRRPVCLLSHGSLPACPANSSPPSPSIHTDTISSPLALISGAALTPHTVSLSPYRALNELSTVELDSVGRSSHSASLASLHRSTTSLHHSTDSLASVNCSTISLHRSPDSLHCSPLPSPRSKDSTRPATSPQTEVFETSLTTPFRRYLASNDIQPLDVSFHSASNDSTESLHVERIADRLLTGSSCTVSDSLLLCLDGADPASGESSGSPRSPPAQVIDNTTSTAENDGSEVTWASASGYLDSLGSTSQPSAVDSARRLTLTDRATNPLAKHSIDSNRRTVVFETNL